MQLGNLRLRAPHSRPAIVIVAALVTAIAMIACRGGGAAPGGTPTIPVINPTPNQAECANDIYPATAPPYMTEEQMEPNLTTTASGLRYMVLEEGSGPSPSSTAPVITRYTGWLAGGCIIDSSFLRERDTSTFSLSAPLILGWKEALRDMSVGEKRMLVIPYDLGYGEIGFAPRVPPKSRLIYYVEMVDILEPAEATATIDAYITATAEAQGTRQAGAEATATAVGAGVPLTTPTPAQ